MTSDDVLHLCDLHVSAQRDHPESQPTLCGIRKHVPRWNPPAGTDLSAKGVCPECVAAFKSEQAYRQGLFGKLIHCSGGCGKVGPRDVKDPKQPWLCLSCLSRQLPDRREVTVQHIIATQRDPKTLCGLDRDRAVMSGGETCPACKEMDARIQATIGVIRDPITGPKLHEFMMNFPKTQVTTKETTKAMDYKSSAVRGLKRGASAGVMKVVSKKVKEKLTEKFPALGIVPQDIWNVLLCLAVNMTANSSPDLPGIKMIESMSAEAFEGLLTDATSKMVQDVIETVSETVMELAEKKPGLLGEG